MYRNYGKRFLDIILSACGIAVLSPVYLLISLAIKIDDPGPVFFKQKRVGLHKSYFHILKFRTMKMDTPHDVPTHLLENPEQYITRVGKFLRKTSLDELPQIFQIFTGKMAVIGPRPALWNQYDLMELRDKYGANDVRPGLTGWAQVNGRDYLSRDLGPDQRPGRDPHCAEGRSGRGIREKPQLPLRLQVLLRLRHRRPEA